MERNYRIFRTSIVGRSLYDTQTTMEGAEGSVRTGQVEYPDATFTIQARYFVSEYTDGPATRWNVIDRQTQEWIRRFPTKEAAQEHADKLNAA